MSRFESNGKLLLTGEYVVLDGATALALPTRFKQSLEVRPTERPVISWISLNHTDDAWFRGEFAIQELQRSEKNKDKTYFKGNSKEGISEKLFFILREAYKLDPEKFSGEQGYEITTRLDFPLDWGLGSSSTLINNLAQWLEIDAYDLLENTFGGSGYDIAAAQNDRPVTYSLSGGGRSILKTAFEPGFKEQLFFVHLNRKQNSRQSIEHYRSLSGKSISEAVERISALTHSIITCDTLTEFELLLEIHETVISGLINKKKIKLDLFPDYPGAVKSLGGWGGDFILATGEEKEKNYFRQKGYGTVIDYTEMIG